MPMSIDELVQLEERRGKKMPTLIALLRDPDLEDFVSKLLNGHRPTEPQKPQAKTSGSATGLMAAIRALDNLPHRFTFLDVLQRVQKNNFDFRGADPKEAIRNAIYFLSRG